MTKKILNEKELKDLKGMYDSTIKQNKKLTDALVKEQVKTNQIIESCSASILKFNFKPVKKPKVSHERKLKHDLEMLGAQVFLDIYDMHGDMSARMKENIEKSDIIFLIGTSRLKVRLEQIPHTNAAFEWEHIQAKVAQPQNKDCLLPLWFEGQEFSAAFPAQVHKDLVRDMREADAHESILAGLANYASDQRIE